jgi:hypothetical protein
MSQKETPQVTHPRDDRNHPGPKTRVFGPRPKLYNSTYLSGPSTHTNMLNKEKNDGEGQREVYHQHGQPGEEAK